MSSKQHKIYTHKNDKLLCLNTLSPTFWSYNCQSYEHSINATVFFMIIHGLLPTISRISLIEVQQRGLCFWSNFQIPHERVIEFITFKMNSFEFIYDTISSRRAIKPGDRGEALWRHKTSLFMSRNWSLNCTYFFRATSYTQYSLELSLFSPNCNGGI